MEKSWKIKLENMSENELREILNRKNEYTDETINYVKELLQEEAVPEANTDTNASTTSLPEEHKKISIGVICIICCLLICALTVFTSIYITNQNNRKSAIENATQRINTLVEDIYKVDSTESHDYLLAKDKLSEIKTLIDENDIDGLPLSKYNAANTYMTDLKTFDELGNAYQTSNGDSELYVRKADKLIREIEDEKVLNRLQYSDILYGLSLNTKKVVLGRAFYAAQKHYLANYPNCTILNICELNPNTSYTSNNYTFIGNNYANEISAYGIERIVNTEKECRNHDIVHTEMLASTYDKIQAKGGYAIFVNYYPNDAEFNIYPPTHTYWWYVGVDISAEIVNGTIKYNITEYKDGEVKHHNGLSTDEALNFILLNPA